MHEEALSNAIQTARAFRQFGDGTTLNLLIGKEITVEDMMFRSTYVSETSGSLVRSADIPLLVRTNRRAKSHVGQTIRHLCLTLTFVIGVAIDVTDTFIAGLQDISTFLVARIWL